MHFKIKFLLCDSPIILIFGSVPDFLTKSLPFRPINLFAFLIAFSKIALGGDAEAGKIRYAQNCGNCHGAAGMGLASYPKISGKEVSYITAMLET